MQKYEDVQKYEIGGGNIYNCKIIVDDDGRDKIGQLGDIEHLRGTINVMKINLSNVPESDILDYT